MNKLLNIDQLEDWLTLIKNQKKRLVVTSGCFDLFHAGHVDYLEASRELGDELLILLNSDESVNFLKGMGHPLNSERYRAKVLTALECVSKVFIFDQTTPTKMLGIIKPTIFTKGNDYSISDLPEKEVIEKHGGEIKLISYLNPNVTISKVKFFT